LIAPLYGGRSAHEVLATLSDRPERSSHDLVRDFWLTTSGTPAPEFERLWRKWLHDGVIPNSAFAARTTNVDGAAIEQALAAGAGPAAATELEISFRLDPSVLDGRFANNGWLQELPKPITKLTWDNLFFNDTATAEKLRAVGYPSAQGGEHGQIVSDVVELKYRGRSVRGAVFAVPGHPNDCVTVHLGYGRRSAGQVGNGAGFDAYALRTADSLWAGRGVEVVPTGAKYSLACTQYHHLMEGRGMVRVATRDEYLRDPNSVHEIVKEEGGEGNGTPPRTITLYPEFKYRATSGAWRSM
jgi:molybdopterin-containing oxidoreductase family iron-sulfur binding subunit